MSFLYKYSVEIIYYINLTPGYGYVNVDFTFL